MIAVKAVPSAVNLTWGIDTVLRLAKEQAIALVGRGVTFRVGYIDLLTPEELADITSVGLQVSFVGFALELDPARTLARLAALDVPKGCTIWHDIEGTGLVASDIIAKSDRLTHALVAAGYEAGPYVGAGCPLDSAQLSALAANRYWHSVSRVLDSSRGPCMEQVPPDDVIIAGVKVDVNIVKPDFHGDVPTFAAA